ncbi:hypothetical protein K3495_g268 [Podosphaera aphanis]|nr:hypothetical protein K3495_g268 [Podosphaera aphanis]
MSHSVSSPVEFMDTSESEIPMLSPEMWSLAYLNAPGALGPAIQIDRDRVAQIYATASAPATAPPAYTAPVPPAPMPQMHRPTVPPPTPFDGTSTNLRPFISQLQTQFVDQPDCFRDEGSKVRYAYRCLGPVALGKMRSSFRCYEDASVPPEIVNIEQFYTALRQLCQDPGLVERANRTVEKLYQKNMKFHDFISIFEDNCENAISPLSI